VLAVAADRADALSGTVGRAVSAELLSACLIAASSALVVRLLP
jgi:hypothetical protein